MAKKKSTPFATDKNGKLYVECRAVMSPMIPFIDGISVTFFGKGKKVYLDIDTAIDWCRKEMQYHSKAKYETMIAVMERAKKEAPLNVT